MARVHTVKAAKDYPQYDIKKGDTYYWWQLYKQPKRMSKTYPRPSQLTGSDKLSTLYSVQETAQDMVESADDITDIHNALTDAFDEARTVAEEYEQAAENIRDSFPESPTADECEEKAQAINDWIDELESAADEVRTLEPDEGDSEEEAAQKRESAVSVAMDAINSLSI